MPRRKRSSSAGLERRKPERKAEESLHAKLFRPNPDRAIFISGTFEQELIYRVTPDIIRLQEKSRDPITVYIDSPGGKVYVGQSLLRLLRLPGIDNPPPCPLITVVTSFAASAAAILLCSGDYVLAYPGSLIHFHGQRMVYRETGITKEEAFDVAKDLRSGNDASAVALARKRSQHFFFRFVSQRSDFAEYRKKNPKAASEKDCFIGLISERLSPFGMEVVKKAEERYKRYQSLSNHVIAKAKIGKLLSGKHNPEVLAKVEAEILKAIIAFELPRKNVPGWTFQTDGLARVNDDFYLLNEYIAQHHRDSIEAFCETWKDFILDSSGKATIEALPKEQRNAATVKKVSEILLPLWLFFGSICHVLQEAENPLRPEDAFWLGLVDEVVGANLPTLRRVAERKPTD